MQRALSKWAHQRFALDQKLALPMYHVQIKDIIKPVSQSLHVFCAFQMCGETEPSTTRLAPLGGPHGEVRDRGDWVLRH